MAAASLGAWRELGALIRRAPRSVRRYRFWCTALGAITALIGVVALVAVANMGLPPHWASLWGWACAVVLGNAACFVLVAVPPRDLRSYRFAWGFMIAWLVIGGLFCIPLLVLAIPAFICICSPESAAWFRAEAPPDDAPPRRPVHPWGYPRPPSGDGNA